MPEFINHKSRAVFLRAADGKTIIKLAAGQSISLTDFFDKYVKSGQIRRVVEKSATKRIGGPIKSTPKINRHIPKTGPLQKKNRPQPRLVPKARQIVGRKPRENPQHAFVDAITKDDYPISNGIGVGILSYNRPDSLKRLMASILKHTDLKCTTIFISDDASDNPAIAGLLDRYEEAGIVCIRNTERLGIAGNSNRLLRCLNRFEHCLLLNDDVEILATGWEYLYSHATKSGIKHFCYRQPGVYGAAKGTAVNIGDIELTMVADKPHGAVMSFTNECIQKIGYFDEAFGIYGMEHVDWSTRIFMENVQRQGFFDVKDSDHYFKIHPDASSVEDRSMHLRKAKSMFSPRKAYICPTQRSIVPAITYVLPIRLTDDRKPSVRTVVNNLRAQRFPAVEIIVVEHDNAKRVNLGPGIEYLFIGDHGKFNKSASYNHGVLKSSHKKLVLHDADLLVRGKYTTIINGILDKYDAAHIGSRVMYMSHTTTNCINEQHDVNDEQCCDRLVGYFEGGSIAINKSAFLKIGGFDEDFVGYGNEDTEFFDRVAKATKLFNERSEKFIHLWHSRVDGWETSHLINKKLEADKRKMLLENRIRQLKIKLGTI